MKKFILIYNPLSGDAYFKYKLDDFIAAMHRRECLIIPVRTMRKEDTVLIAQLAEEIRAEGILIAGGDGTVHEVVNVILGNKINLPIGIIPSGTSNDLANFLGLPNDIEACADLFSSGQSKYIDVGLANGRYFLSVASAGLLATVAHTADTALKNTLGKVAYYLKGFEELPRFKAIPMQIDADGIRIEEEVFLFVVANGGTVGSFPLAAPDAVINDGKLDMVIINRCSLPELMRIFITLLSGNHINNKFVTYIQASSISITSTENVESDLDGERGPLLPLQITTIPQGIGLYSPVEPKEPQGGGLPFRVKQLLKKV